MSLTARQIGARRASATDIKCMDEFEEAGKGCDKKEKWEFVSAMFMGAALTLGMVTLYHFVWML